MFVVLSHSFCILCLLSFAPFSNPSIPFFHYSCPSYFLINTPFFHPQPTATLLNPPVHLSQDDFLPSSFSPAHFRLPPPTSDGVFHFLFRLSATLSCLHPVQVCVNSSHPVFNHSTQTPLTTVPSQSIIHSTLLSPAQIYPFHLFFSPSQAVSTHFSPMLAYPTPN